VIPDVSHDAHGYLCDELLNDVEYVEGVDEEYAGGNC
jgi:hypothetical protein